MQQANIKTLRADFLNPLARMLPLRALQSSVYRMAEKEPPGLPGYQPRWEVVNGVIGAQQSLIVKVDVMSDWHLLAIGCSASVNTVGGFRAQFYDLVKQRRLNDRGIQFPNLGGGNSPGPVAWFFLREPYRFDLPKSQMQIMMQNLEAVANTVQLALYGQSAPFTGTLSNEL
jgi:hypothetical protein